MALNHHNVEHLQLPFNLLDWRWAESGVIATLRRMRSVTVHARSVFLQGILACGEPERWPRIDGIDAAALIHWIAECTRKLRRKSPADLCLAYVRSQDWIGGAVVGMETEEQVEANLFLSTLPPLTPKDCEAIECCRPPVPEQLLDPARWPRQ
jgi:aryl-alcohol dehydrogenase-like predicted oxidoreductase